MYPGLRHCAFFGWVHGLWSLGGVNKRKQAKCIKFLAQGLDLCNLINGEGQSGLACWSPWSCTRVRHDWATEQPQQMMTTNLKKEKDCAENRVWRWRRLPPQTSLSVPVGFQTQLPLNTSNIATCVQKWPYAFSSLPTRVSWESLSKKMQSLWHLSWEKRCLGLQIQNITDWVAYKQQKLTSCSIGGWEVQGQGAGMVMLW